MRIALATPMKPIDDPRPSGDRTMARLILKALQTAGHEVEIATRFRAWRADGGVEAQRLVEREALVEADRIAERWTREGTAPDLFLTYHLYHKAPDWIGPRLADLFSLPYAIIEASRAPKRQSGPWSHGFAAADKALARADAVAALHRADAECLSAVVEPKRLVVTPPFLDAAPYRLAAQANEAHDGPVRLLAVGMMRDGDKERSYRILAEALSGLQDLDWRLSIVGDGPARDAILPLFPDSRLTFLGARDAADMPAIYAGHDVLVWPAIREAFGFVFLEAQAAGLCVVGGDTFGVPDIVRDGETGLLSPEGDAAAFAANLRRVIGDAPLRHRLSRAAQAHVAARHDLAAGIGSLARFLDLALQNRAGRFTPAS
ncbi:glycosyltransferase family 4 protein [Stappia sp. F7233]|uniref:Glycosyltransferase family 4 protein n=1 Tax=Stappia albiluteola TaxID=2758565 RepID=A0A839A9T3_9HYPH|nr:glycosyltransferase family 4 protein [Stappia albiluteola]MBA5776400.1 glycosyltransferase family 4 protein [Stappia albiluteola]